MPLAGTKRHIGGTRKLLEEDDHNIWTETRIKKFTRYNDVLVRKTFYVSLNFMCH